ncbi:MAG: DEAD/DEAH box helicase, partial [Pseudonocardiaceae bacterium]
DLGMPAPAETYSTSEHLFSDLDIPTDSTGRLPVARRTRAGLKAEPSDDGDQSRRSTGIRRGERNGSSAFTDGQLPPVRRLRRRTRSGETAGTSAETAPPAEHPCDHGDAGPRRRRRRSRSRGAGTGEHGSQPRAAG